MTHANQSLENQSLSPQARNALRHGLTSGQLPSGAAYIARCTAQLRAAIEDAVLARHGKITLTQAATIQSVVRWERHGLLCQRWLRIHPGLTADQQLAFSREAARASAERDKCLRLLELDAAADPMAELLAGFATETPQTPAIESEAAETIPESTDASISPANDAGEFGAT